MENILDTEKLRTFKQWSKQLLSSYDGHEPGDRAWFTVGDWLLNAKENDSYKDEWVGYHVCMGNYRRIYCLQLGVKAPRSIAASVSGIEDGCLMCDEPMPEGIKMIALMEKM